MTFNILHLNVERSKHIETVIKLLKEKNPHIVCLAEAMHKDVQKISLELGYEFSFAPLVLFKDGLESDQEGSVILSKHPILKTKKYYYNDKALGKIPSSTIEEDNLTVKSGKRPENRFLENYTLLTALIKLNEKQTVTISTTHFPVTDHTTPGYKDHNIKSLQNVDDMERSVAYLERLINIIRSLTEPVVFTADLNNPRGEYFYDSLARVTLPGIEPELPA